MTLLLIRPNRNDVDQQALAEVGISTYIDPYLSIREYPNPDGVQRMRAALTGPDATWLVVTSTNALPFFERALQPGELVDIITSHPQLLFAAIGTQTERQLIELGASRVLRAGSSDSGALAKVLLQQHPASVVLPSGSIAMQSLTNHLRASGCEVIDEVIYATEPRSEMPPSVELIHRGEITGVLLRSPSAARAFTAMNGAPAIDVFCAGETTAAQARTLGLLVSAVSPSPEPATVARTIRAFTESRHS